MEVAARRSPRAFQAIRSVVGSSDLRKVEIAFAGFGFAEYATWVAIMVYAYEAAGPTGAGVAAVVQLVPSAVVAPIASTLGDLVGRRRSLIIGYMVQASAMAAVAVSLAAGAPLPVVFGLAAVAAASITFTRPAQWAIQASLAETAEQLMAANVMTTFIESGSVLIGPALAGVLLGLWGPWLVFTVAAAGLAVSATFVVRIRKPRAAPARPSVGTVLRESRAGLSSLMADPRSRLLVALMASRSMAIGALDVLAVVLAFRLLAMGPPGAGYLTAAIGGGALIGAAGAVMLVGRSRLSRPLRWGLGLLGLSVAAIAALPNAAFALLMLAGGGIGATLSEVSGRTLLQRIAPEDMRSRVFGLLEGLDMAALAVGSIAVPPLIWAIGVRWTLVALGGLLPAFALVAARGLRTADSVAPVPGRPLALLREIGMFGSLDPATAERLATALVGMDVAAGTTILRQGEAGDRFYLVAEGGVEVTAAGRLVATLGPADHFGEIALIRDVPRTATVTARTACRLYFLERDAFLEALHADPVATAQAESVVRQRSEPGRPGVPTNR